MSELRDKTRTEHARIESVLRLTHPSISLTRYVSILAGFHEFLRRWEPMLAAALPLHLRDWAGGRRRSAFVADDLRHLGATGAHRAALAEHATAGIPMADTASALGSMYVIEGSALGGQVITPMLKEHLGLTPATGASYFHGHGPATGAMWRDFREVITRELGHDDTTARIACLSAQRTFTALCEVFEGLPA